ncbi:MAG: SpoIIE family protein phosphatase [Candidatus Aenigmarchaeota archaeon]|nr:SpoIIE family protein phosphatase [Candidatus Aenigmarchaeota archaeon]
MEDKYIPENVKRILSGFRKESIEKDLVGFLSDNFGDDIGIKDARSWKRGMGNNYYLVKRLKDGNGLGMKVPGDHPHIQKTKSELIVRHTHNDHTEADLELGTGDHYMMVSIGHKGQYILAVDLERNPDLEKRQREVLRGVGWLLTGALDEEFHRLKDKKYRERLKASMQEMRMVQEGILPERVPEMEGFDIDGGIKWRYEVGGDYYDFIQKDDRIRIAIADVSGKGLSASSIASGIHATFNTGKNKEIDVFVNDLNAYLHDHYFKKQKFATGIFGDLKRSGKKGEFVYVNAGHNYPMIFSDKGVKELKDSDMALGWVPDLRYRKLQATLDEGSGLFLFTDGINEASDGKEEFGTKRIKEALMDYRHLSTKNMGRKIVNEVMRSYCHKETMDDKTWVVVKNTY